jgi:hypothetical protein
MKTSVYTLLLVLVLGLWTVNGKFSSSLCYIAAQCLEFKYKNGIYSNAGAGRKEFLSLWSSPRLPLVCVSAPVFERWRKEKVLSPPSLLLPQLTKKNNPSPPPFPHIIPTFITVQAVGSTNNIRRLLQEGEDQPAVPSPEAEEPRVISPGTATPEEIEAALGERAQLFPGLDQQEGEGGGRRLQQQGEDEEGSFLIIQPVGIIGLPPIIVVPLEAFAPAPETETEYLGGDGGRRLKADGDWGGVMGDEQLEEVGRD